MSFKILPFPSGTGAEVLSLDTSAHITDEVRGTLLEALHEYLVLVFRDQNLSVAQQIQFTERLGSIEIAWDTSNTHPEDSRLQVITNAGRKDIKYRTSSQHWHSDRSFVKKPSKATLLHIKILPPTGGDTLFANMRKAYETLPNNMIERIQGLHAKHSYSYQFLKLRSQRISPTVAQDEERRHPDVLHPLVRTHPVTGRKALYLSELCVSGIVGMEENEGELLLGELYRHSLKPELIYRHNWRMGDLLVWDNPSLMHRVAEIPHDHPRVLHRTTLAGDVPV